MIYFVYVFGIQAALLWPLGGFFALLPITLGAFVTWIIAEVVL